VILALGARPGGVHPSEWCVSGGKFGGSRSGHAGLRVKCVGVNAWRSGGRGKRAGTLLLQRWGQQPRHNRQGAAGLWQRQGQRRGTVR